MSQTPEQRRLIRLAAAYNTKARKLGVYGVIRAQDLGIIEQMQPYCQYCEVGLEVGQGTFDHVVPLNRGGKNQPFNIVRCCVTCNRRKFTKSPAQLREHEARWVTCERPGCGNQYKPRWAEYEAGRARLCSRRCSALMRWQTA
jgi:5-methylcytosine-specific restriction endonuclease McrA